MAAEPDHRALCGGIKPEILDPVENWRCGIRWLQSDHHSGNMQSDCLRGSGWPHNHPRKDRGEVQAGRKQSGATGDDNVPNAGALVRVKREAIQSTA
jgi:hypothetical protein